MEQPLVSIVIPVYNAAPDLARCIESVRKQTYRNIEVFLVNDGSKDASSPICHMYERIDPRVHVIDKENAGVSAARNTGIAAAQGKYIQFVDSDDYLAPGATATLIERAEHAGADMVIAHYYRVDGGKTTRHGFLKRRDVMDQREFARELMDEPASFDYGVLWNKLYRTALIRDNGVLCREELNWSEDFLFNLEYIRYAHRFCAVDTPVYYYVKNEKSITHTQIDLVGVVKTKAKLFTYYKGLYESLGLYEKFKPQIYKYLVATAEHPMDYKKMTETRQSCRAFDPVRTPDRAVLTQVLEAARLAPSACNSQPYHFYVAVDGTARAVGAATQSLGMNKFAGDCPAFIVVVEQPYNRSAAVGAKLKDQDYRAADIGLAVSQLVYRAHELGLSTCILGWFDEKTLQALLNTNARVRLIIAIGYARADDALRTKKRKSLEELVTWL